MIKVGIVGGTGYTGVELLRLLAQHPDVELVAITSRSEDGLPVATMFPSLRGRIDLAFSDPAKARLGANRLGGNPRRHRGQGNQQQCIEGLPPGELNAGEG